MPAPRYNPPPEALREIRQWREARKSGRRPRPYAKELCAKYGIGETTLYKVAARDERI